MIVLGPNSVSFYAATKISSIFRTVDKTTGRPSMETSNNIRHPRIWQRMCACGHCSACHRNNWFINYRLKGSSLRKPRNTGSCSFPIVDALNSVLWFTVVKTATELKNHWHLGVAGAHWGLWPQPSRNGSQWELCFTHIMAELAMTDLKVQKEKTKKEQPLFFSRWEFTGTTPCLLHTLYTNIQRTCPLATFEGGVTEWEKCQRQEVWAWCSRASQLVKLKSFTQLLQQLQAMFAFWVKFRALG